jgi:AraC family transcriptional regulator, transcriptional activator of pobA
LKAIHRIKTISEYHKVMGLPQPEHPLISVVDYDAIKSPCAAGTSFVFDFYSVILDKHFTGTMKYGQQQGDFESGVLFFMAPGQLFEVESTDHRSGYVLLIHPDLLWQTHLGKAIKNYEYFSYSIHEALFLSVKEQKVLQRIIRHIETEYKANIDKFSELVIIAQLELLFTYSDRFYQRQFITRKISNHSILQRLETLLADYFNSNTLTAKGIPTVQYIASSLNVSAGYLSSLLKMLTGQSTQHYIHEKLIELAKEKLSTTDLSVSEIAYELGFDHPQSFSRLFKTKTNLSPLKFRELYLN